MWKGRRGKDVGRTSVIFQGESFNPKNARDWRLDPGVHTLSLAPPLELEEVEVDLGDVDRRKALWRPDDRTAIPKDLKCKLTGYGHRPGRLGRLGRRSAGKEMGGKGLGCRSAL